MTATFTLDPRGLLDMLNDSLARAYVEQLAKKGAEEATRIAPVLTGDYKDSIMSTPAETTPNGAKATFGSSDSGWHFVEFGSINNPPHRVLRRAAQAIGVRFEEM